MSSSPARRAFPYLMVVPYALLLFAFGIFPALYILYLSFVRQEGGFAGLSNFIEVAGDFRYASSFGNIAVYAVVYMVPAIVIALALALILQSRLDGAATVMQVVYYLPQGLVGAAGVVVWLFMLTPAVSPAGFLFEAMGLDNIVQVVSHFQLAVVLAIIAVWTSGNAVLLLYAALRSIPHELIESARIDGAAAWQIIVFVKIPLLRKWLAYILILNAAGAIQVFAEPVLVSSATAQAVGNDWSPLQLAYSFAYRYVNFPGAAALALQLLVIGVIAALVIVKFTDLFEVEV